MTIHDMFVLCCLAQCLSYLSCLALCVGRGLSCSVLVCGHGLAGVLLWSCSCLVCCAVSCALCLWQHTCSAPLLCIARFHDLIGGIHVPVDDGVDKLNRKYTLLVFLFLALPIFTKQYIGDPIECFTPTYFTEPQARYVNSYCWTASTYYLVAADADDDDYDGFTGQVMSSIIATSLRSLLRQCLCSVCALLVLTLTIICTALQRSLDGRSVVQLSAVQCSAANYHQIVPHPKPRHYSRLYSHLFCKTRITIHNYTI